MSIQQKNTLIFESIQEWRVHRKSLSVGKIGLVATMGNLHAGHVSLMQKSVAENDFTVLTIFVNPTQFDRAEDLENYPRTLEQDIDKAKNAGVDFILIPKAAEIYHDDFHYRVTENQLSLMMEGQYRPGHFCGVLTVVLKFFMIVKPHRAYFGEKDYQQYKLIEGMAAAFFLDIEVIGVPIKRAETGLALSSRNNRLSAAGLRKAAIFSKLLSSNMDPSQIQEQLIAEGFKVDYITEYQNRRYGAVWLENIRLIDNVSLHRHPAT